MSELPNSVLYVKNGEGGEWWNAAKENNQIHAGFPQIPAAFIRDFDIDKVDEVYRRHSPNGSTQDINALKRLLDRPSQHVWITVQNGHLWWCLVEDKADASDKERTGHGHFWLTCKRAWSDKSLGGHTLSMSDMPGPVQKVGGFRGKVCKPEAWEDVLRIIQDKVDERAQASMEARSRYEEAVKPMIASLTPHDFELLIELILARSGWERITKSGGVQEGIDLDVENAAMNERAFVQVKSTADQNALDDYVDRYQGRPEFHKMIFAVHSPEGKLAPKDARAVVWADDTIAKLVVRLGLGERLERMRGRLAMSA